MKKINKLLLVFGLSVFLMIPGLSIKINASVFGISASNNGDGTTTVYVSGQSVGTLNISVAGQSQTVAKRQLGDTASATFNTGAGTFNVYVVPYLTDADYNLYEGEAYAQSTSVTVTVPDTGGDNGGNTGGDNGGNTGGDNGGNTGGNNGGGNTAQPPVDNGQGASEQKPADNSEKKEDAPDKKDSNSRLKSLSVDKGTLNPEFSVDQKNYNLILPKGTTELDVKAEAESAKAKVEIKGNKDLKIGSNLVIVTVTAEDESFTHYEITTIVDEDPSVFLDFGSKKLGVVVNAGEIVLQEGYEETTIKVNGKDVKAYKNALNERTILYLSNDKGDRAFYLYDTEKNEVIGKVNFLSISGRNYAHIELPDTKHERAGMTYGEVEVEKNKLLGWKYEDESLKNFVHVYLMNEEGVLNFYQYESSEQSIQIYHDGDSNVTKEDSNAMTYVAIGLGVLALAGISFSAYLWFTNKRKNEVLFRREQREKTVDEDINDEKED